MLKPTGYLAFELDDETGSQDRANSLSRAFSYVSPVTVRHGDTNRIFLTVKLPGKRFWDATDAEQQAAWDEIVAPWLAIRLRKIQETLQEYNNAETKSYCGAVVFDDCVIQLDGRTVQCAIIDDQLMFMADLIGKVREADNAIAEGAVVVAPTLATAAGFERRTDETTATMSRLPEPEPADETAEGTEDEDAEAPKAPAKPAPKPRRLTIKERDALRRDPFTLITDFEVTTPEGEVRSLPLL